jgi:hypothetical protein
MQFPQIIKIIREDFLEQRSISLFALLGFSLIFIKFHLINKTKFKL